MCGILSIFGLLDALSDNRREYILKLSKLLRHRGPDWNGIYCIKNTVLAHERLTIIWLITGSQPIVNKSKNIYLSVKI